MDLNRLSMGEKLAGLCALVLFILSFLKLWAKVEVSGAGDLDVLGIDTTQRFSAWDGYGFLVKLGLIAALILVVLVVVRAVGANVNLPMPWGTVYLILSGITLLAMILALLIGPDESGSGDFFGVSVEISRGIGLFIGTALALGMAAGSWMANSEESSGTASPVMPTTPTTPTTPPPTTPTTPTTPSSPPPASGPTPPTP